VLVDSFLQKPFSGFGSLAHYLNNTYLPWLGSPLVAIFGEYIYLWWLILGATGYFFLLSVKTFSSSLRLILIILLPFFPHGLTTYSLIPWAYLPWLILSLRGKALLPFLMTGLCVVMEGQVTGSIATIFALFYGKESHLKIPKDALWCSVILFLIGILLFYLAYLQIEFPKTKIGDHVVLYDYFAGYLQPRIGVAPPLPLILRSAVKENGALLLTLYIALLLPSLKRISLPEIWIFLSLLLDLLPETISTLMPLSTISRLVPGFFFLPLSLIILPFLISLRVGKTNSIGLALMAIIYFATFRLHNLSYLPPSPSTLLNREFEKELPSLVQEKIWNRLPIEPSMVKVSVNEETLQYLLDLDEETRWSSGLGRQIGGEWLKIILKEKEYEYYRVLLSIKKYPTDFPRGITVSGVREDGGRVVLLERKVWQGPLFLKEISGVKICMLGSDSLVLLEFAVKDSPLFAIEIKQTNSSDHFDWSIGELKLWGGLRRGVN
jgi:hypothetical protein